MYRVQKLASRTFSAARLLISSDVPAMRSDVPPPGGTGTILASSILDCENSESEDWWQQSILNLVLRGFACRWGQRGHGAASANEASHEGSWRYT
jgi:hypothetical protein